MPWFGSALLARELPGFAEGVRDRMFWMVAFRPSAELHANKFADPVFFHRDAVEHIGAADRALVMRDDDELALSDKAIEDLHEPADV